MPGTFIIPKLKYEDKPILWRSVENEENGKHSNIIECQYTLKGNASVETEKVKNWLLENYKQLPVDENGRHRGNKLNIIKIINDTQLPKSETRAQSEPKAPIPMYLPKTLRGLIPDSPEDTDCHRKTIIYLENNNGGYDFVKATENKLAKLKARQIVSENDIMTISNQQAALANSTIKREMVENIELLYNNLMLQDDKALKTIIDTMTDTNHIIAAFVKKTISEIAEPISSMHNTFNQDYLGELDPCKYKQLMQIKATQISRNFLGIFLNTANPETIREDAVLIKFIEVSRQALEKNPEGRKTALQAHDKIIQNMVELAINWKKEKEKENKNTVPRGWTSVRSLIKFYFLNTSSCNKQKEVEDTLFLEFKQVCIHLSEVDASKFSMVASYDNDIFLNESMKEIFKTLIPKSLPQKEKDWAQFFEKFEQSVMNNTDKKSDRPQTPRISNSKKLNKFRSTSARLLKQLSPRSSAGKISTDENLTPENFPKTVKTLLADVPFPSLRSEYIEKLTIRLNNNNHSLIQNKNGMTNKLKYGAKLKTLETKKIILDRISEIYKQLMHFNPVTEEDDCNAIKEYYMATINEIMMHEAISEKLIKYEDLTDVAKTETDNYKIDELKVSIARLVLLKFDALFENHVPVDELSNNESVIMHIHKNRREFTKNTEASLEIKKNMEEIQQGIFDLIQINIDLRQHHKNLEEKIPVKNFYSAENSIDNILRLDKKPSYKKKNSVKTAILEELNTLYNQLQKQHPQFISTSGKHDDLLLEESLSLHFEELLTRSLKNNIKHEIIKPFQKFVMNKIMFHNSQKNKIYRTDETSMKELQLFSPS